MRFKTITLAAGTQLHHGSASFHPTSYGLPVLEFPAIAFFSSAEIASRYGPVTRFTVLASFEAVVLDDPLNLALWRHALPEETSKTLSKVLNDENVSASRTAPHEWRFDGLPARSSVSPEDKRLFSLLMDVANVDALFVSRRTTMDHPELAVRFRLASSSGMHRISPCIERVSLEKTSLRDAWISMAASLESAAAPREVGHPSMKAYVVWLWQWCRRLNVGDDLPYLFAPLGLVGKRSLWEFEPPDYHPSMAAAGVSELHYRELFKTWSGFFKTQNLSRALAPLVLAVEPVPGENRIAPFIAYVERPCSSDGAYKKAFA